MMKKIIYIAILSFSLSGIMVAQNQQPSLRERIANRQMEAQQGSSNNKKNLSQLSVRAQIRNQNNTQDLSRATWVREIYRELDLTKGTNATLYHPVTPTGDRMNLYTLIFKLMANGELDVYQFNEGQDSFTEDLRMKPEDMFERLEIPFTKEGNKIVYDEYSIPSNEALGYYIKEAWYFDHSNSVMDIKIVAICPVLYRDALDDFGFSFSNSESIREPQFWIPYENIRPYAARMPIMTSDLNNTMNNTVDDYFRLRLYEGDIYKTTNMANKVLLELYKTPEEIEDAQKKIEQQLVDFEKGLWVINDSTKVSDGDPVKRNIKKRDQPKGSSSSSSSAKNSARERRKNL